MKISLDQGPSQRGFTLIEIAIVMVIIGLLAGAGTSLVGTLTHRKARNETQDYLNKVREALINFASNTGALPQASADEDGTITDGDGQDSGFLPYLDLSLSPTDSYKRVLQYEIDTNLSSNRTTTCAALKTGLSGSPDIVDADGSTSAFSVAAVIVSAGPMDADSDGNVFDDVNSGTHQGDNRDGAPNYLRFPPVGPFDDLVVYIGEHELYGHICEYLTLAVNNNSGSTIYIYDQTRGTDLGSIASGGSPASYEIISGTRIEIRDTSNGNGNVVTPTTPPTPIILAGTGSTINIP